MSLSSVSSSSGNMILIGKKKSSEGRSKKKSFVAHKVPERNISKDVSDIKIVSLIDGQDNRYGSQI